MLVFIDIAMHTSLRWVGVGGCIGVDCAPWHLPSNDQ